MNEVLRRHDDVRALLDHGWLNLWAMDGSGAVTRRYQGGLSWSAVEPGPKRSAQAA
ncbi:MAG: hypothetical protein P8188_11910 [Gemmatimonadota bacterium]